MGACECSFIMWEIGGSNPLIAVELPLRTPVDCDSVHKNIIALKYNCIKKNIIALKKYNCIKLHRQTYISPEPIAQTMSSKVFHSCCLALKAFDLELEAHHDALFQPHKNHLLQEQLFGSRKWLILPEHDWHFVCQPLQAKYLSVPKYTIHVVYYRKISNIRRIKSQNFNDSRIALQLSLPNLLKPGVKSRWKM